jgi:putative inorganic carbon (hco3(-)) transporter
VRDLVILALLVITTLWALRQPWIGVLTWTCVSLMSPHAQFGYAAAYWPVATGVAISTLVGLLLTREKRNPFSGSASKALLAFTVWLCVTLPFSMIFEPSYELWQRSMKIFLMVFVTISLIDELRKLNAFVWVCVVSIAYYGVKGGVFTILTAGSYRVWGPGGFIEGNNEVALAVIMVIPMMRYLQLQMTNRRASMAMTVAMVLCVITVLGTYSRGALLGLGAMGAFFWLKSSNKALWGVVIMVVGVGALSLMPDQWWSRMDTIKTYDSDSSAMGRINAWWMAFNLAKANFFGGGFMIWTGSIFALYAPVPDDPHAAHSIYFQVLGEHGFIGLFLFLLIGACTWWSARGLIKSGKADPQFRWAADLGAMLQVSMIGYAVAGAFLSLAYYDLPYNVMIMAVVAQRMVRAPVARTVAPAPLPARPRPPQVARP